MNYCCSLTSKSGYICLYITDEYKDNSCLIRYKSWCNIQSACALMVFILNVTTGARGKKIPWNSTTPILHIVNIQSVHNTYSIWYKLMWTETYILWNRFNWHVAMVWYGNTVTLIYMIISGISRSLQTYIDKLSGENTTVIKVWFIHAHLVSSQKCY